MTHPLSILIVCTGNICRSPFAEMLLADRLGHRPDIVVGSAGVHALAGRSITEPTGRLLVRYGVAPRAHEARQLTGPLVEAADLILTATTAHRDAVVQLAPTAFRRTFTLRRFGRLAAHSAAAGLLPDRGADAVAFVQAIADGRTAAPAPRRAAADEIIDPYRRSDRVYRRTGREISEALDPIVDALARSAPRG